MKPTPLRIDVVMHLEADADLPNPDQIARGLGEIWEYENPFDKVIVRGFTVTHGDAPLATCGHVYPFRPGFVCTLPAGHESYKRAHRMEAVA